MGWLPDGPLNIDHNIHYLKAFHYIMFEFILCSDVLCVTVCTDAELLNYYLF